MKKKTTVKKKTQSKKTASKDAVEKKTVKKVVKKAVRAARVKKLPKKELERFRELLLSKMSEIVGDVDFLEGGALKKSRGDAAGDLSSMPIHMADIGTDNYEQEFSLDLVESERKMLGEVIAALGRIDDGSYGICEAVGRAIRMARLEAKPWARYCIEYARLVESGVVIEGEPLPEGVEI